MWSARKLDEILHDLNSLIASDFDLTHSNPQGMKRLHAICDELEDRVDFDRWAPALFDAIERLPDSDLGSPGPIVHILENRDPEYIKPLRESIQRMPTPLTAWMVNRIINESSNDREEWLTILASVLENPRANHETKQIVREFVEFQSGN